MKKRILSILLSVICIGGCLLSSSINSLADSPKIKNDFHDGEMKKEPSGLFDFRYEAGRENDTLYLLDRQSKAYDRGDRSQQKLQGDLDANKSRAQDMVNMLKDEQMQIALKRVTLRGKQVLQENQEFKNPLAVLAGAATLWFGKTVRLIRNESFLLNTRIDGRGRTGEFSMESPLFNGRLRYQGSNGVDITVNRKISSINTGAELNYNMNSRAFSSQLRHNLVPNVDLTFGASQSPDSSQTDGRAGFEYRLDF